MSKKKTSTLIKKHKTSMKASFKSMSFENTSEITDVIQREEATDLNNKQSFDPSIVDFVTKTYNNKILQTINNPNSKSNLKVTKKKNLYLFPNSLIAKTLSM